MAANDLERLVVQLSADITKYERALTRANTVANRQTRAVEQRFTRMQSVLNASFAKIGAGATAAFAAIGGARGFKELSDAGTQITNSLKVTGLEGQALEKVYDDLRDAALRNAAPFKTLADLYSSVSLNQKELGITTQDLTTFSGNIALALRVGGKSAQEASGALLQLSQALGGGVVRAEEFNSLIEGAPTILQAAAAGIQQAGGSVAKLRKIMLDGQLSSKALFDGIQAGSSLLQSRAAGAVLTYDQAFENLKTSLINVVREFEKSTKASENLAAGIDSVARAVGNFDISGFIQAINDATKSIEDFLAQVPHVPGLGELLGYQDSDGNFLNPDLQAAQKKIKDFEGEILQIQDTIEANPKLDFDDSPAKKRIEFLRQQLNELRAQAGLLPTTVDKLGFVEGRGGLQALTKNNDLVNQGEFYGPNQFIGPNPVPAKPIDIEDPKYRTKDDKDKKARKEKLDDFQREVVAIRERTDATNAETAAQSKLNPLVNDYGYAVDYARARQDLATAAIKAGLQITPELSKEIDNLADSYAKSGVAAAQLSESQDKIRQRQQELLDIQKDVTRGLVDDLIEGKSAADAFAGALKRVASALLDSAFTNFFNSKSSGGGGGFGGLFSLLGFASGGFTGPGGTYQPAGIVHKGEYVIPKNVVDRIGADNLEQVFGRGYASGGLVGNGLAGSSPATISGSGSAGSGIVYAPVIDARGASIEAVARLERIMEADRRNFSARVEQSVLKARQSNKKGF